MAASTVRDSLARFAEPIETTIRELLPAPSGPEGRLFEAMSYATLGAGKHLRPYIVEVSAAMFDTPRARRLRVGAAVEMVHAYSLVHDDLPAMDDDDLRRGKPSCHRAFDEATAILAGDALLTLSFETLAAKATHPDAATRGDLVAALAAAAGPQGMVGGQMIDLQRENVSVDIDDATRLASLKTGALIAFSAMSGAIVGQAGGDARGALDAFGSDLGLAFQITDDLLDIEGDEKRLGKRVGKDTAAGKATMVSILGAEGARREIRTVADRAVSHLEPFGARAEELRRIVEYTLTRDH